MDGFENFEQQERSWDHLQRHHDTLVQEAVEVVAQAPRADLAGVILEAGTPEFETFRRQIQNASGQELVTPLLVGVVPREVMLSLLEDGVRARVEEAAPAFLRRLPVVAILRDGFRFGVFELPG